VLGAFGSGCRGAYLARLAWEEVQYLGSAAPATQLLATAGNPARRRALESLLDVRAFAIAEGLDVGGSYRKVADTGSSAPFQVVTAAYADRLKPYTWWYPVIGAIPYRGYFELDDARRFAKTLQSKGLETMIVEASAYSTLGWFDDPLPSSVVDRGETSVVVTVLHELVHQTFFAPGEVAFNETLATAAAWRLAERYYTTKGDSARAERMRFGRERWIYRSDVMDVAADRLRTFFETAREEDWPRDRMLAERERLYEETLVDLERYDPEFAAELRADGLNNASFLASWRYAKSGRAIDVFLARQPSIKAGLDRLSRALKRRVDLRDVVYGTSQPPPLLLETSVAG
jgi:predicted aminopeptidase